MKKIVSFSQFKRANLKRMTLSRIKLKPNDHAVLSMLRFSARDPVTRLAERTGLQVHSVRDSIRRFEKIDLLTPYMIVDIRALGLTDYAVFVEGERPSRGPSGVLALLMNSKAVPWVVEFAAGRFGYAFSLVARHISEVDAFLLDLGERGQARFRQSVTTRVCWCVFGERYLIDGKLQMESYEYGLKDSPAKLDELDWKLLRLLSAPHNATLAQLARELMIPISTIDYHINSLECRGVIVCYANLINVEAFGMHRYHLLISERRHSRLSRQRLMRFLSAHAHVTTITTSIGEWDYEVEFHVSDPQEIGCFEAEFNEIFRKDQITLEPLQVAKVHKLQPLPTACKFSG